MKQEQGILPGGQFWQSWSPEETPRAVLLIAHGLAEHSGRYQHVAEHLVASGYAVFAVDHIGHGRSPGKRVLVDSFDDLTAGVNALADHAAAVFPDLPVSIIGHSMGGLIAALCVVENPRRYHALVLSGPAVIAPDPPPAAQLVIVRLLSRFAPGVGVLALEAGAISTDPAVVDDYLNDPLVHTGKVTARMAATLFDAMGRLRDNAEAITIPMLAMHGDEDRLTAPEGSALLVERASSEDKSLRRFPGLFHEIFNEPQRAEVLSILGEWLDAHH